ncbi:MAG: hypothetical protein B6D61_10110 [Bacteroidetes bacterium 4484_249]|nr:MAG: hypothetical protein B6D61_10110 [Bacteroidetes bacterium 4484_249]
MSSFLNYLLGQVADNYDNIRVPLSAKQRETIKKVYPYYGAQNIIDYVDDYIFDGEYILVAEDGENLKSQNNNVCNLVNGKFWVNNHAHIIKAKNDFNTKYLYYYLNLVNFKPFITGSAQPKLTKDNLNLIPLQLPDLPTQKAIAKVLSDLDAKIELNNKINQELEAMAKTLYDYWFVQFDFPDENGKPYKSSGGKMVYNEELKREIPNGWKVVKIGNVLKTVLGGTPKTKNIDFWNGDIPWLNSGEIANFPIINSEAKITNEAINQSATALMKKGTVLISITRHLRPSILAIDACANQSVVGILETNTIKSSFIYPTLKNEIPRYMALRTGAQQPHINKETIDETFIILPQMETLEKYYKIVNPIYSKIINTTFQNQQLIALRDWLLPMLMNGQVVPTSLNNQTMHSQSEPTVH